MIKNCQLLIALISIFSVAQVAAEVPLQNNVELTQKINDVKQIQDVHERENAYIELIKQTRLAGDKKIEAASLYNVVGLYFIEKDYPKSIEYAKQSLPVFESLENNMRFVQMELLIGQSYRLSYDYNQAIDWNKKALEFASNNNLEKEKTMALRELSTNYGVLGQFDLAISYVKELAALKNDNSQTFDANLRLLGIFYVNLEEYDAAINVFKAIVDSSKKDKDKSAEAEGLYFLGRVDYFKSNFEQAKDYLEQALKVDSAARDLAGASRDWALLAMVNANLKDKNASLQNIGNAITVASLSNTVENDEYFHDLMLILSTYNNPTAAIFYGKRAVNILQKQKVKFKQNNWSSDLLSGWLGVHHATYDLLISELTKTGRHDEALQVEMLLKEDELFEFSGRDPAIAEDMQHQILCSVEEQAYCQKFEASVQGLASLYKKVKDCESEIIKSSDCVIAAKTKEQALLDFKSLMFEIDTELPSRLDSNNFSDPQLPTLEAIKTRLSGLDPGTVLLHYLTTPKQLLIFVTPIAVEGKTFVRRVSFRESDLNQQISALRQSLEDKTKNPLPAAQALYDMLIRPISADLDRMPVPIKTLMVSNMGKLREVPFTVLHDGKSYLAERYALANVTLNSEEKLLKTPNKSQWKVAGMGVSKATTLSGYPEFPALPNVPSELAGIVKTHWYDVNASLPGEIKLNDAFNFSTLQNSVNQFNVLHIASHFVIDPTNDTTPAFLILGDNSKLALTKLKKDQTDFGHIDLLTLSACKTGVDSDPLTTQGRSYSFNNTENLGALLLKKGANSVLASLWQVSDASTSEFMQKFYKQLKSDKTSKAEAIRQVQVDFLRKNSPLKHPYFWAPFILMGNWR